MGNESPGLTPGPAKVGGVIMASEGNQAPVGIVHLRKRGPGQCVICGETWTDRYLGTKLCGKKHCYYLRAKAKRRTQASENKEGE